MSNRKGSEVDSGKAKTLQEYYISVILDFTLLLYNSNIIIIE